MERAGEPKIVLLVRLLNAIDEGRYSFEDLKDKIAEGDRRPSTRSLRRYLAILADAGFPWFFERTANRYRFADGYSLKRLELSSSELFGLVALRSLGATLGGTIGSYVDEVTAKVVGSTGSGVKERLDTPPPVAFRLSEIRLNDEGERIFGLLSSAERSSRAVSFNYSDKEGVRSKRLADPYGFIVSSGRVYCVAYDRGRRDMRTFAVDNISGLNVTTQTFVKPADFNVEEYAAASISGVLHSDERSAVRVRFAPRVAKAAVAARVVADRAISEGSDGSTEIEYSVADVDELLRWILTWGAQAEVLEPPAARERMAVLLNQIAARYASPAKN